MLTGHSFAPRRHLVQHSNIPSRPRRAPVPEFWAYPLQPSLLLELTEPHNQKSQNPSQESYQKKPSDDPIKTVLSKSQNPTQIPLRPTLSRYEKKPQNLAPRSLNTLNPPSLTGSLGSQPPSSLAAPRAARRENPRWISCPQQFRGPSTGFYYRVPLYRSL